MSLVAEYGEEFDRQRQSALCAVEDERDRQDAKWGIQNHDVFTWLGILGEEYGELCQMALVAKFGLAQGVDVAETDVSHRLREEAVQVAAVAVAMIECIDRNGVVT